MEIKEMSNWEILTYLRLERNWMVQSHYSREDIEELYELKFTDDEWSEFTEFACDSFENFSEGIMSSIIECWNENN